MQFIGAGGFSAVYAVQMSPPYDLEPVKVSLKVVDDKILNEVYKGEPLRIYRLRFTRLTLL
jgi:hypothetical protein